MSVGEKLRQFDLWLIERVLEPVTWRIEYLFGKNNYWLARAVTTIYLVARVAGTDWKNVFDVIVAASSCIVASFCYLLAILLEKKRNPKFKNVEKVTHGQTRSVFTVLTVVDFLLWDLGFAIGTLILTVFLYLIACDLAPPAWKEERDAKKQGQLVPSTSRST